MKRRAGKRGEESGFALLLVFVLAAAIAITLYMEVPRVAFESQRDREQRTIDHALQYQRAIQLFYRKYHLYPQTLDDLETTRNIRFLRRRFLDPLTGKEFRLLHVGPTGQLTDSLVTPLTLPGSTNTKTSATNASQTGDPNDPNAQAPDPLNMAARRPSDRISGQTGPGGGGTGIPAENTSDEPPDSNPPAQPGQPGLPSQPGFPVQPGLPGQSAQTGDPNQPNPPQDGSQPTQNMGPPPQIPGQPPAVAAPGQVPVPGQFPFQQNAAQQGAQGAVPGAVPNGASNQPASAAAMIQQLLTTPRQPPSTLGSAFGSGNTGGIAGVASTAPGKGIHEVNDHSKYKEWEFVYDLKKDKTVVGAAGAAAQQQVQQQMQQPGGLTTGSSPFGSSPFSSGTTSGSNTNTPAAGAPSAPPPQQ